MMLKRLGFLKHIIIPGCNTQMMDRPTIISLKNTSEANLVE